jgi:hypothetical protein
MDIFDEIDNAPPADPMPAALRTARALLPMLDPFMGAFAGNMKWKPMTRIAVMATNCLDTFFYNPEAINKNPKLWTPSLLACVIAHEVMHILRMDGEFTRDAKNKRIANVALDAVINRDLLAAGWKFPGMAWRDPYVSGGMYTGGMEHEPTAIATKYRDATARAIYDYLAGHYAAPTEAAQEKQALKDEVKPRDESGEDATEESTEAGEDATEDAARDLADKVRELARKAMQDMEAIKAANEIDATEDATEEAESSDAGEESSDATEDDSDAAGEEAGEDESGDAGDDGEADGDESGEGEDAGDFLSEDDGLGDMFDAGAGDDGDAAGEADGEAGEGDASGDAGEAPAGPSVPQAGDGWSLEKSAARGALEALGVYTRAPNIRFMRVLGAKVAGIMRGWPKRGRSMRTPHALSREYGRLMPGPRNIRQYHVAIAIDASGSISHEILQKFTAAAHAWARKFARQSDIHIAYYDTAIMKAGPISDFMRDGAVPEPGGGTDYRPAFDAGGWLESLPVRPTHVLHFTDLHIPQHAWPAEPDRMHVIHIVPENCASLFCPWGDVVPMPTED